jgi:GDP-D-mannose 3', 5'-epimerase
VTRTAIVVGAGGFIGGHLVKRLLDEGTRVVGVDVKPRDHWHQVHSGALSMPLLDACWDDNNDDVSRYAGSVDEVYHLAADMGGIGFIETHKARCMLSIRITTGVLRAALKHNWGRVFYSSSACIYPVYRQRDPNVVALREDDAYPADPEDGYGWEKLFGERMHRHFTEDYGVETRVARYHNVYGPNGDWIGGREKAPAALSRKMAEAELTGDHNITVWGDGEQTRSFTYVDDAVEGTLRLMRSDVRVPLNVGSGELVTINQVLDLLETYSGITLQRHYDLGAPQGVRGRNSDNTLIKRYLEWEPMTPLSVGLERTYRWVYDQAKLISPQGSELP